MNMKKCILAIILYVFALSLSAQTLCEFEKKLNAFRYSLYKDISNAISNSPSGMSEISKIDQIIYKDPVFSTKIKKFMKDNQREVVAYQTDILKKYNSEWKIDTALYDPDLKMLDALNLLNDNESFLEFISYDPSIIDFSIINPHSIGYMFNGIINSRNGVASLSINSIANQIAAPRIFSRLINADVWEVVYDYYWHIIVIEIDLDKGILSTKTKAIYRLRGLPYIL